MIVVCCSGGFDPLHRGHRDHFKAAKALGDRLVVIVNRDEFLIRKKGLVSESLEDRVDAIKDLPYVDEVIASVDEDMTVAETLRIVRPQIFAQGKDWDEENPAPQTELDACKEIGCEIRYGVCGEIRSSTQMAQIYPTRERLPSLLDVIKGYKEVWSLWTTGEQMARIGVFDGGNISRLLLRKPEAGLEEVVNTTRIAQSAGTRVRWYTHTFPFSLNICSPYSDVALRMEALIPYMSEALRPTIIVDYRSQPELCRNMIRAYETVWWRAEEPTL